MWPKCISLREVIIVSILYGFRQKNRFFEGWSLLKFKYVGKVLGMTSTYNSIVAKGLKLKVRKVWKQIPSLEEVTGEKMITRAFLHPPPTWARLTFSLFHTESFVA